jgi:hypothetical protein
MSRKEGRVGISGASTNARTELIRLRTIKETRGTRDEGKKQ